MTTVAIILSAGSGLRMGHEIPKQFLPIAGKPVMSYTLAAFESCKLVDEIIVVSIPSQMEKAAEIARLYAPTKFKKVIAGGTTRQESSYLGINVLNDYPSETIVLMHDAVRPFVNSDIIARCIEGVKEHGAADVAVPAIDTMIQVENGFLTAIPDRSLMYNGQTPQGFRLGIIREAHDRAKEQGLTNSSDDVRLVMSIGKPVRLVMGSYDNIKITHPNDIALAEYILSREKAVPGCRQ